MASCTDQIATLRDRWRTRRLERALKRRRGAKADLSQKVPPVHHRGNGG